MSSTTHDHDDDHHIPFDIQKEIIKKVQDVKSLLRFRSVSKPWKSEIDSSKFIADYKSNYRCILASYQIHGKHYLVCMVDDGGDSFPRRNPTVALPLPANTKEQQFIGNSQGLFCFHAGRYQQMRRYRKFIGEAVVVWNPSIRKSVTIDHDMPSSSINFGVCPRTKDPKFVKINCEYDLKTYTYISNSAQIYTLSSGAWRSLSINLPDIKSDVDWSKNEDWHTDWPYHDLYHHKAAVDGTLYWHVYTNSRDRDQIIRKRYHRIITFDLASEEFGEVCLPESLATIDNMKRFKSTREVPKLCISKRNESLVVLQYFTTELPRHITTVDVWVMEEHGASKLLTKLFTITRNFPFTIKGFRMNGQPIIETTRKMMKSIPKLKENCVLQVYDPCTGQINNHEIIDNIDEILSIYGVERETLLLLNH